MKGGMVPLRRLTVEKTNEETIESTLDELGGVSADTHGGFIGHTFDGGFGLRPPAE